MPIAPKQYRPHGTPTPAQRERGWASRQKGSGREWYNLNVWRGPGGLRHQQLTKEPLCEDCLKRGHIVPATDVDHKEAHNGDWDKFIDHENLRSLCKSCHSRKTIGTEGINAK